MADLYHSFGDIGSYIDDGSAVTLGVAFTVDATVDCVGVAFYKDASETTSTGRTFGLWSHASGTLLASGTHGSEASSGEILMYFSTAYELTSGTVYVVGKFSPEGRYRACNKTAVGGYDQITGNAPYEDTSNGVTLTLPSGDDVAGRNGRYAYAASLSKPVSTYSDQGYTVSPIIDDGAGGGASPLTAQGGALSVAGSGVLSVMTGSGPVAV